MTKYHAKRSYSQLCQRWFDSKLERTRGEQLCLLEKAGEIERLVYQQRFVLSEKPKVAIVIDFSYWEDGKVILEDAKGMMTPEARGKLAWLKQKYGIDVVLWRG